MTRKFAKCVLLAGMTAVLVLAAAPRATAQTVPTSAPRFHFNVKVGDTIWLESDDRTIVTGRVAAVSGDALELEADGRRALIPGARVLQIEKRYQDGVGNGLLRGLAVGAAVGALAGGAIALSCNDEPRGFYSDCFPGKGFYFVGFTILGSSVGLVTGGLIDLVTPGRKVAYERRQTSVKVHPLIGRKGGGAMIGVTWR